MSDCSCCETPIPDQWCGTTDRFGLFGNWFDGDLHPAPEYLEVTIPFGGWSDDYDTFCDTMFAGVHRLEPGYWTEQSDGIPVGSPDQFGYWKSYVPGNGAVVGYPPGSTWEHTFSQVDIIVAMRPFDGVIITNTNYIVQMVFRAHYTREALLGGTENGWHFGKKGKSYPSTSQYGDFPYYTTFSTNTFSPHWNGNPDQHKYLTFQFNRCLLRNIEVIPYGCLKSPSEVPEVTEIPYHYPDDYPL